MHVREVAGILLVAALIGFAPRAEAQCAGFDDVSTGSSFCTNVVWLKNRGITLGCTATSYCPNDAVIRITMAAFLNRLGNVLTPQAFGVEDSGGAQAIDPAVVLCETPDIPGVDYARTAKVDAALSFQVTGEQDVSLAVAVSKAGGAWQVPQDSIVPLVAAGERRHGHVQLSGYGLTDGASVPLKFGLQVVRGSAGLSESLASWACQLQLVVRNAVE